MFYNILVLIYFLENDSIIIAESIELSDLEGYAGIWKSIISGKEYSCHFGFNRYSEELGGDFDNRGGEPLINEKYKNSGWQTQFTLNSGKFGYYWNTDCIDKWW